MTVPLTEEYIDLVITPASPGVWLYESGGRVIFALRLGGGGYLVGRNGHPSIIAATVDELLGVTEQFITSLPPEK